MKRLAWLTDIHLNFVRPRVGERFLTSLAETNADGFLIGGDIGEATDVELHLNTLSNVLRRPIYFVLGNHDFYRGSIADVRTTVRNLCSAVPDLHWLVDAGVVPLTDETCLVGHDGWGDGRLGDYRSSDVMLNDWVLIEEFGGLDEDREKRLAKLNALGDDAAVHLSTVLPDALRRFRQVVVLTHVPPFREACWHEGRTSDDNWLPHFTCKAVGDVLRKAMTAAPGHRMTVLCGHTHSGGDAQVLPNLHVLTGSATYGQPAIQRVLEVD
jgi:Icc protein